MKNIELVNKLISLNYHISFAESCTGGMVCSSIVDVSDASKVLDMSFVTYASEAKVSLLGVDSLTIEQHGVVSEKVAYQMATGVKNKAKSNIGVGITGIAGPNGGSIDKPIGMVCFGFAINDNTYTFTKYFGDLGRTNVRLESTKFVIEKLLELLD
jgi:PncC family amidohydrolase